MDDLKIARGIAAGRVLFGALMLFLPEKVLAKVLADAPGPAVWLARAFGIRDVVIGLGTLRSLAHPEPEAAWVQIGALADTADAVAAVVWRDELGTAGAVATVAIAAPAATLGWKSAAGIG